MALSPNLFPNPSAEINTTGVEAMLGSLTRDAIGVKTGTSFKSVWNDVGGSWYFRHGTTVARYFPVTTDEPVTISMMARAAPSATLTLRTFFRDASGALIEFVDTAASVSDGWVPISHQASTFPAGTEYVSFYLLYTSTKTTGAAMWMTDIEVRTGTADRRISPVLKVGSQQRIGPLRVGKA